MIVNSSAVAFGLAVTPAVLRPDVERMLHRFCPKYRPVLRELALRHPYLANLIISFPGLFFALAVPRRGVPVTDAIATVIDGRSLQVVAGIADVPLWLRKLPPEAFRAPVPKLPDGELFRREIANVLPRRQKQMAEWLEILAECTRWGTDPYAIWAVRVWLRNPRRYVRRSLCRRLAVWAWFSSKPQTLGGRLTDSNWDTKLNWRSAGRKSADWFNALDAYAACDWDSELDVWFEEKSVNGFDFVAIRTPEALVAEGAQMKHWIASYAGGIRTNQARVFRVMKGGKLRANFALRLHYSLPFVVPGELLGKRNRPVPADLAEAAMLWFISHPPKMISQAGRDDQPWRNDLVPARWQELFKPYWLAKRTIPVWLPMVPVGEKPLAFGLG